MRKQNSEFVAKFVSEEGSKLKNKDYFGCVELDEFACYVIADGITDSEDAEGARLAIETIIMHFQASPSLSKHAMRRMLKLANRALLGKDSYHRLKASVTVVVTDYQKMRYGYAGNTRLRMYRSGTVFLQTKDMSLSWDMAEQEKITMDEIMRHEERNNLYTYFGQKHFKPVISKKIKLQETDMVALYTRGIWENVEEAELDDVFAEAGNEVQETVDNIEDLLLSRQPEKLDNYTLAVIFVNKVYQNPEKRKRRKKIIGICIIIILLLLVISVIVWFLHNKKIQRTEDMNYHFENTVEYINAGNYIRAREEGSQAQELAEKLKDNDMRKRIQEYLFVIETVIMADESYDNKAFAEANRYYLSAMERSRYADNIGTEYMTEKMDNISTYLSIEDDIALGDRLAELGNYEAAEEKYLQAKKTALKIHDPDGKQEAMDALEKLYDKKEAVRMETQEEAESQAREEVAAAEMVAEGDRASLEKDYVGAKVYYTMAAAKYAEMSDKQGQKAAEDKLAAIEDKLKEQEEKKNAAQEYEAQAMIAMQNGDMQGAKSQYMLARTVYQEIGSNEDMQRVQNTLSDMGSGEESWREENSRKNEESSSSVSGNG